MIVINREPGQALVVNGDVTVRVLKMTPEKVWLAISAPPDVRVLKEEDAEASEDGEMP